MKFEVRWINGYWSLFDTDEYASVWLYGLKKDAATQCAKANAQHQAER
jgi:hypothetical protein